MALKVHIHETFEYYRQELVVKLTEFEFLRCYEIVVESKNGWRDSLTVPRFIAIQIIIFWKKMHLQNHTKVIEILPIHVNV